MNKFKVGDRVRMTPQRLMEWGSPDDILMKYGFAPEVVHTITSIDKYNHFHFPYNTPEKQDSAHLESHLIKVNKPIIIIKR